MSEPEPRNPADEISEDAPGVELGPVPIGAVPGIARIAVGAWLRGAAWSLDTTIQAGRRLTEAALSGESATQLIEEARDEAIEGLRRLLEPGAEADPRDATRAHSPAEDAERRRRVDYLRRRGAALFERAAEIPRDDDPIHPGFDRIIDQLAPDEARILKLLVNEGPQAVVYVHRAAPLGLGARDVARRLSLIGREAGCLRPALVPAYIDNLVRLGLVAIRRDPVPDETAYQVLEAQPEVVEAMKSVNGGLFRGQVTRRSIHITDFGRSFCQVCFPPEHLTSELPPLESGTPPAPARDLESAGG